MGTTDKSTRFEGEKIRRFSEVPALQRFFADYC
jgi:hypothetical protein